MQIGPRAVTSESTNASSEDTDNDGVRDEEDNCEFLANTNQDNTGGLLSAEGNDNIGDACQCGDLDRDGRMLAHMPVGELDKGQGTRILRRLLGDKKVKYTGEPVLASVYAAAREAGWRAVTPKTKPKRRRKRGRYVRKAQMP